MFTQTTLTTQPEIVQNVIIMHSLKLIIHTRMVFSLGFAPDPSGELRTGLIGRGAPRYLILSAFDVSLCHVTFCFQLSPLPEYQ